MTSQALHSVGHQGSSGTKCCNASKVFFRRFVTNSRWPEAKAIRRLKLWKVNENPESQTVQSVQRLKLGAGRLGAGL